MYICLECPWWGLSMWPIVRGSSINGSASIHQSFQMYVTLEQFCCSLYLLPLHDKRLPWWLWLVHHSFLTHPGSQWSQDKCNPHWCSSTQGVTQQLATMMTPAALPSGQEHTKWRWGQWLYKAGEFYRNMVCLRNICQGGDSFIPRNNQGCCGASYSMHNPYAMDTRKTEASRITLSLTERAECYMNCIQQA